MIVHGIRKWITDQQQQGIKVYGVAFRMYPNIYLRFCEELRHMNISPLFGRVIINGVNVGFDVMRWQDFEDNQDLKNKEYNHEIRI